MKKVICIFGPTGSGKTSISIKIAKRINTSIISADAMQIYKGMDIGTAKITKIEMGKIPHYMIDIVEPDQYFSTYDYFTKSINIIKTIQSNNQIPVIVGGTGLYFKALFNGMFKSPEKDDEFRKNLENENKSNPGILYDELIKIDKISADKIHKNDLKRIIRALEVYYLTGKPISSFKNVKPDFDFLKIGLLPEREKLYENINFRCDKMIEQGIIEETQKIVEKYGKNHNSLKAIGYSHAIKLLDNQINYEEFVRLFKRDTRRYAKRQFTLFKSIKDVYWFEKVSENEIFKIVDNFLISND